MKGISGMSRQPTLWDLPNATGSQESGSGPLLSDGSAGPTTVPSGPDHPHASLSPRQAQAKGLMMSGTFGRTGTGSSNTTVLTSLLASKLREKTASGGSILYRTTWQELTTPAGRSLSVLRASAWTGGAAPKRGAWNGPYAFVQIPWLPGIWLPLPVGLINLLASAGSISGNVNTLSGYPTPRTGTGEPESAERKKELGRLDSGGSDLQAVALMTGWSTASARDWKDSEGMSLERPDGSRDRLDQLPRQAQLAGWTTASATDGERGGTGITEGMSGSSLTQMGQMAGWPTSRAEDAESSGMRWSRGKADTLTAVAQHLAGWPTAMAGTPAKDGNSVAGNNDQTRNTMALLGVDVAGSTITPIEDWGPARITTTGEIMTGSFAKMDAGGQLDPDFSRWLMRLPDAWANCAPTETASTLKRRSRSRGR